MFLIYQITCPSVNSIANRLTRDSIYLPSCFFNINPKNIWRARKRLNVCTELQSKRQGEALNAAAGLIFVDRPRRRMDNRSMSNELVRLPATNAGFFSRIFYHPNFNVVAGLFGIIGTFSAVFFYFESIKEPNLT